MTKSDLKILFGSIAGATKAAVEHGASITEQGIHKWKDDEPIPTQWAALFYLIMQHKQHQVTIYDVLNIKKGE